MDTTRLEHRKAQADAALLQVSAAKRRLQRASWLEQRRVQRVLDSVSEVAFILFVWSCPDATMALAYVAAEEGRRQLLFPTLTREALEGRYLEAPVEVVGDIWRGAGGCCPARLAKAKRYCRDDGLCEWVCNQNEGKAVAPTPDMVIRCLRAVAAVGEPFAPKEQRLDHTWASRKWVCAVAALVDSAVWFLCGPGEELCDGEAGEGAALASRAWFPRLRDLAVARRCKGGAARRSFWSWRARAARRRRSSCGACTGRTRRWN